MRSEVFEFWPSDILQLFAQAGMPRRKPPVKVDCGAELLGAAPHISSPIANVTYTFRLHSEDERLVPLSANADGDVRSLHWFVDESYVGTTSPDRILAWRTEVSGRHLVRVVDDQGRADSRELNVSLVP